MKIDFQYYTKLFVLEIFKHKVRMKALLTKAAKERGLDPKAEMWKLPASEVGGYAEERTAELTLLNLWHHLKRNYY